MQQLWHDCDSAKYSDGSRSGALADVLETAWLGVTSGRGSHLAEREAASAL
jgi:hypothetical protein